MLLTLRHVFLACIFTIPSVAPVTAQTVYRGDNGEISFVSDAPLELIRARSENLRGIINEEDRKFAFSVEISTLDGFNNPLQKVHFNENYMESKDFPTASFSGKIIEKLDLSEEGTYQVRAKGILKIHGIERERIIQGDMEVREDTITISSRFTVLLEDHSISIPKIVKQKISEVIEVSVNITLQKQ